MDTAALEERLAQAAPQFERAAPYIVAVFTLVTLLLAANLFTSPPTFQTDLNDFAPESEASLAHDRVHEHFPDEMRPLFVHVTMDDGSNVLTIDALQAMNTDLEVFQNESTKRQNMVAVWTTTPGILQLALDEEADGETVDDLASWPDLLTMIFDDNETCVLTSDDQCFLQPPMPPLPCCTRIWITTQSVPTLMMNPVMAYQRHLRRFGFSKSIQNWKKHNAKNCKISFAPSSKINRHCLP